MAYSSEEIIEPFWADYASDASGRDPLAIQNSSVVIYTKMMTGITNVTNRIRYNGFYCWLFEIILLKISKKNSLEEQIRYLRRAELLLAYVMVKEFPDITGVSGSAFAGRNLKMKISLKNGADWDLRKEDGQKELYWKFKLGVFGQYYSGVARDLNLINHPQGDLNIYTLTDKGKRLAVAFGENIPSKAKKLFWESVFNGFIIEVELSKLIPFALHIIPSDSEERRFYESILMANDRKSELTSHRKKTLTLLLQFLKNQKKGVENLPSAFLRNNYISHTSITKLENDTATAWYLYEINEVLHVSFEHFHSCFLFSIERHPTLINACIDRLLKEQEFAFKKGKIISKVTKLSKYSELIAKKSFSVYYYYDAMGSAFRENNFGECIMNAINTILCVYNNCKKQLSLLKDFAALPEYNFNRTGYAIELIEEIVESKWEFTIEDYTKSILLLAVNLHIFSSYSKTKVGQSLVHNYMIEDNSVWRLRETFPSRTTPRLQNAIQYITDIGWLKRDGKHIFITEEGIKTI